MNGIINVLKPPGMMSNGVVVFLRRVLGTKKIGHTGTLDPGAAGVLPICVGRATKLSDYIMNHEKCYIAEITFGAATDTLDAYGKVAQRQETHVSETELLHAIPQFLGEIVQVPPMYSAIKVGGQKLYQLARKGKEVEIPSRRVTIHSIEMLKQTGEQSWLLRIRCSKGTYIRTLLADIGGALGALCYTSFLLRESSGGYSVESAFTVDEIREMAEQGDFSFLYRPDTALMDMPAYTVKKKDLHALINGVPIEGTLQAESRLYCGDVFLGVGEETRNGIKLKIHLFNDGEI